MPATAAPPARVTLHTLGECRIVVAHATGATTLTPASDRLFSLALLLAADAGRPMPRARVAAWLWPDLPEPAARHALRQLVYRLRRLGVPIAADAAHLTLSAARDGDAGPDAPPRAGRCLPGWNPRGDAFRAWLDRYRATTEAAARATLARALADARAANRDGIALAAALLELDPRHPLARATLPRMTAVHEAPPPPDAVPCVGRDDILRTLGAHAAAAHDGHGSAVLLVAAAGAGVSRVIAELARSAPTFGFSLVSGAPPGLPSVARTLAATVRTLLDRPGALGCSPDALRVVRRFATTPVIPAGDTTIRRLGIAVAELARAVAAESPLLLAIDARCATPSERALAAAVARALDGAPVLAVFAAVPSTPTTLGTPGGVMHVVPVPVLADDDAAALARAAARTRGTALHADDLAWCTLMAGGRPGDVVALATACAARPGTRVLPAALAARLHDRIAALPVRTRHVAALCALLGDTDVADRAARALGRPRAAVDAALCELRRANLPGALLADDPSAPHRDAARVVGTTALATLDPADHAALLARAGGDRQAGHRRAGDRRTRERRAACAAA